MIDLEPDVLIVEDDDGLRDALCRTLEAEGLRCHSVNNAAHALAGIQDDGWRPRVILLDLMMPRMNGWQFLEKRKLSESLKKIPVIVMSAVEEPAGSALPAERVLKKPVKVKELLETVKRFL